jgi:hypothetical protein
MSATESRGAGSGEVMIIVAFIAYFLFMGWIGNTLGFSSQQVGTLSDWHLPYVEMASGWAAFITGTVDFLIAVINIFAWVIGALVSYAVLIGWGFTGDLPMWVSGILFTPLAFGFGWLILSMIRGRS